jgi:hypothetical protein
MFWLFLTLLCLIVGLIIGLFETHMQMVRQPVNQGAGGHQRSTLATIINILSSQVFLIIAISIALMSGNILGNGAPTALVHDGQYQLIGSIASTDRNYLVLSEVNAPERVKNLVVSKARILLINEVPESEVGKIWIYKNTVEIHMNTWTKDQFSDNVTVKTKSQFQAEKKAKREAEVSVPRW